MLVAPAGYGKTTLAEQWVGRDGRRGTWYTARSASTDVAALALGIAKAATAIIPDSDVRLRTHMRALPAPAENEQTLAEILGEDLAEWPSEAWLVIDDYHEIAQEPKAEDFVSALVAASPVQFLIASRVRPSWVTTKHRLYGEVLEISQRALAMDSREASEVLLERGDGSASGLVALANGWPAVIGLASASSAEIHGGIDDLPESLYRFFADEVFSALDLDVQAGLTTLAAAPVLDTQLAALLLQEGSAERVCQIAVDVGLLVEREGRLDLHPLARAFLDERAQIGAPSHTAAEICLTFYRERGQWDAAFDVVARGGLSGEFEHLMRAALDDLLDSARVPTLERWCDFASRAKLDAHVFALARAEIMLRQGRQVEAMAHAERAADDPALAFRALSLAARAAHLGSRDADALALYERAATSAGTEAELRDAQWGRLVCVIDLELPGANELFSDLSAGIGLSEPRDFIRAVAYGLHLSAVNGKLEIDDADLAAQLVQTVDDPLTCSSFLNAYATILALMCRYTESLAAARQLRELSERCRLDFALPYADAATAMALSGLKQWRASEDAALRSLESAKLIRNVHAELTSRSILLRLYAQQGKLEAAMRMDGGHLKGASNAVIGEFMASQALVLACAGRTAEARESVAELPAATGAVEVVVLREAVEAVSAVREGRSEVISRALALEKAAVETGALDLLVVSYRSCPELMTILLRASTGTRFRKLVQFVGDHELARASGHPIADNGDRRQLLTRREMEVFELLRLGLSNREIAKSLVIEESTAKAHTHRIYDKLGVRSRHALAVQAALERADQATSATESESNSDSS